MKNLSLVVLTEWYCTFESLLTEMLSFFSLDSAGTVKSLVGHDQKL